MTAIQAALVVSQLLIISAAQYIALSEAHVLIKPTDNDPPACGYGAGTCHTLSYYLSTNPSIFNESNSEFEFLPGTHTVKGDGIQQLTVQGVHNVTWYGHEATDTKIVCETAVAFIFTDIEGLWMSNLLFSNCGHWLPSIVHENIFSSSLDTQISAAVAVINVQSLSLRNVTIQQSKGYGLFGVNFYGSTNILSCSFLENNNNCSRRVQSLTNSCIGGNVMLAFLNLDLELGSEKAVHLIINNTLIFGGFDSSEKKYLQCKKYDSTSTFPFRANGLAIVNIQQKHKLFVNISHSSFMRNTGINTSPAILVYDNSSNVNKYTVSNCSFREEGTFKLSIITVKCSFKNGLCDRNSSNVSEIVTIEKCTFTEGAGNGLLLCAYPYANSQGDHLQVYHIAIQNCVFRSYNHSRSYSALKLQFDHDRPDSCPNIRVRVRSTLFYDNKMSATTCILNKFTYGQNLVKSCHVLLIESCDYYSNVLSDHSVIFLVRQGSSKNYIWQHPNGTNDIGVEMDLVKMSDIKLSNNTSGHSNIAVVQSYITFEDCSVNNSAGRAVGAVHSVITMQGHNVFKQNTGQNGGALFLEETIIHLSLNSNTLITQNRADFGGGMFANPLYIDGNVVVNLPIPLINLCTFSFPTLQKNKTNVTIQFEQNVATKSGDAIYGALYENCYRVDSCSYTTAIRKQCKYSYLTFEEHFSPFFKLNWSNTHEVSSVPNRLCLCSNGSVTDQCKSKYYVNKFSGQKFIISLAAAGQFNGLSRAIIKSTVCASSESEKCEPDYDDDIDSGQSIQKLPTYNYCGNITYTVNSHRLTTRLHVEIVRESLKHLTRLHPNLKLKPFTIRVKFSSCPTGFKLAQEDGQIHRCECMEHLYQQNIACDTHSGKIIRTEHKWIGFHNTHPNNITIHNNCPFDYCNREQKYINLSTPDEQCNYSRIGVLCGACQMNLSIVLGTSNCKKCPNHYLLLLIPFTLAGLVLVVLLLKCNLTVSTGHINGIIFYANVIQVNKALLFPNQGTAYEIFSIFIAWLNLDLGIETCFFHNMDTYAKVWLQFVFPVYLWILIALVIISANYSTKAGRLIGSNSVPVLATLFLLSYAKLLRAIIASISFTFITFEDGSYLTVWLQDGNVEYLSPKHAALVCVALLFTIGYILPLTVLALFAPCLQARSHHKTLKWVNRLKPFLDAYQGPYSDNFRYWTGLLLILRVLLFIIFAANYENDPSMSFFWSIMIIGPIAMICLIKQSVYRHKIANLLETISLLNIVIVCAVNWLTTTTGYGKWHPIREYAKYISMVLTVLVFLFILVLQPGQKLWAHIYTKRVKQQDQQDEPVIQEMNERAPTCSVVELDHLKEPLLDTD